MSAWQFFYAARISRPVLHCPVLPSAPNCPLLALTPKTIDTGPLSYKVFHISKELLASPFVHLDEGFMLILPFGELHPQLFSMPFPTLKLKLEAPQWELWNCARQECWYTHRLIKSICPVSVHTFQSESKKLQLSVVSTGVTGRE